LQRSAAGNFPHFLAKVRDEMMNFNLLIRSYREVAKWITILSFMAVKMLQLSSLVLLIPTR
jgi:hypothetical protein